MRKLPNAALTFQAMQHVQDGAAMLIFRVAVARLFERKEGRRLREVGEGNLWIHDILIQYVKDILTVCLLRYI